MRAIRWTPVVLLLCLALAACNSSGGSDTGVGPDLYTASLPENTKAQDDYVAAICAQAGGKLAAQGGVVDCIAPDGWTAFVQAGMNDIDQRCDQYLVWLDQRKRHRGPIAKQISDTGAAVTTVVSVAYPTSNAITALTQVFNLARNTFENLNDALLLEAFDHSTVQTVVLRRQNDFRESIAKSKVSNRPSAIYVLRSYLRICMPITIVTEINTTVTTLERADEKPAALIDGAVIAKTLIATPQSPVPEQSPIRKKDPTRFNPTEEALTDARIRQIQHTMCVPADGSLGLLGSATRRAISQYLNAHESQPSETINTGNSNAINAAVKAMPDCAAARLKNTYEVAVFGVPQPGETMESAIASFQDSLAKYLQKKQSKIAVEVSRAMDDQTRSGIKEARKIFKPGTPESDELDAALRMEILLVGRFN